MNSADTGADHSERQSSAREARPPLCCCGWGHLALLPVLLAYLLYLMPSILDEYEAWRGYRSAPLFGGVSPGVGDVFRVYDSNGDGCIDPHEFSAVLVRMRLEANPFTFEDHELDSDKEAVALKAEFTPLVIDTMTKFKDKQLIFGSPEKLLPGLLKWKEANHPLQIYGVANFKVFLPPSDDWPLGKPYHVIIPSTDDLEEHSNRYHPPPLREHEGLLYALLSQFHPNVFLNMRFNPRGTIALVRAHNEDYLDVVIRMHAEFQLNEEPDYPFWFTPGQFAGRLIINRQATHIVHFDLTVPTGHQLNVDMEWLTGPEGNEVDIGFMPKMSLRSILPSRVFENGTEFNETGTEFETEGGITWENEIVLAEARDILERTMFPFKKVTYLPFLDAMALALREGKLVHSILLWGALDDQSC